MKLSQLLNLGHIHGLQMILYLFCTLLFLKSLCLGHAVLQTVQRPLMLIFPVAHLLQLL